MTAPDEVSTPPQAAKRARRCEAAESRVDVHAWGSVLSPDDVLGRDPRTGRTWLTVRRRTDTHYDIAAHNVNSDTVREGVPLAVSAWQAPRVCAAGDLARHLTYTYAHGRVIWDLAAGTVTADCLEDVRASTRYLNFTTTAAASPR